MIDLSTLVSMANAADIKALSTPGLCAAYVPWGEGGGTPKNPLPEDRFLDEANYVAPGPELPMGRDADYRQIGTLAPMKFNKGQFYVNPERYEASRWRPHFQTYQVGGGNYGPRKTRTPIGDAHGEVQELWASLLEGPKVGKKYPGLNRFSDVHGYAYFCGFKCRLWIEVDATKKEDAEKSVDLMRLALRPNDVLISTDIRNAYVRNILLMMARLAKNARIGTATDRGASLARTEFTKAVMKTSIIRRVGRHVPTGQDDLFGRIK